MIVLHRLMVSDADRSCEQWLQDYAIPDSGGLYLKHFCRAMASLGEDLDESDQQDATPFAPRCVKVLIEERLFERRDLSTSSALQFLETTRCA